MRKTVLAIVAAVAAACSDGAGPVPSSALHFVVQDATAPELFATRDSFWAKVGEDRLMQLFYQGSAPGDSGEEFLRFEVKADGLLRRPDGTAFQPGDSILITVTVVDPDSFEFTFEPSGLVFNPADPARLRIEYNHSNHDFNDDGTVDAADSVAERQLDIWRREASSTLWTHNGSVKNEELEEIEAQIRSFTQFAVAW